jgi:choline-glycine betaine transporter
MNSRRNKTRYALDVLAVVGAVGGVASVASFFNLQPPSSLELLIGLQTVIAVLTLVAVLRDEHRGR